MYQLIIIWDDGQKEEAFYETREEAERIRDGYQMAFGKQINFICINERR